MPRAKDFTVAVIAWMAVIPAVAMIEVIVQTITQMMATTIAEGKQLAVEQIQNLAPTPYIMYINMALVCTAIPFIEELIFRGYLYNAFKQRIGKKWGGVLAALIFAIFHLAPAQGVKNLELLPCLWLLGCCLGYIYERQQNLWAPILLHMIFNAISLVGITLYSV